MDTVFWLLRIAIFWLMSVPMLTLIHELGHALAGLLTTRGTVTAGIGSGRDPLSISLGRLRVDLRPFSGFVGFCNREQSPGIRSAELLFYAAGPMLSLLSLFVLL